MKITYCSGWSRHSKRTQEIWDESCARKAYEKRELYAVLIGDPQRPHCFIESNMDYIGVEFLDERLRNYVSYQFVEKESGKLFLIMMVIREFIDYTDDVREGTSYIVDPNGKLIIRHQNFVAGAKMIQKLGQIINPTPYWVAYPEFGKYVELVQERPIPCPRVEEV